MAYPCTFGGVTVQSKRIARELMIGTAGANAYELELECITESHADYTALAAMYGRLSKTTLMSGRTRVICPNGTSGTLVFSGASYTTCYIESISAAEVSESNLGVWEFRISFVRHTAG